MKATPSKPMLPGFAPFLAVAAVLTSLAFAAPAHADGDWIRGGERRVERRDAGDFWRRSAFAHEQRQQRLTTAQISQALYGSSNEPYDTPTDLLAPEASPSE